MASRDWDEGKHSRNPKGSPHGGRFTSRPGTPRSRSPLSNAVDDAIRAATGRPSGRTIGPLPGDPSRFHRDLGRYTDMIDAIRSGEAERVVVHGGLSGAAVQRVRFNNGATLMHKRIPNQREADAEHMGALVGEAVGAPVPRALRISDTDLYMDVVPGENARFAMAGQADPFGMLAALADTDEGRLLGLLDQLIGNNDRNAGNWLVGDDGRISGGIDHGGAWKYAVSHDAQGRALPGRPALDLAAHFENPLGSPRGWADNDMTPADMRLIRSRLQPLEDDFAHIGLANWWDETMERLTAIQAHAKGSRNRVAP